MIALDAILKQKENVLHTALARLGACIETLSGTWWNNAVTLFSADHYANGIRGLSAVPIWPPPGHHHKNRLLSTLRWLENFLLTSSMASKPASAADDTQLAAPQALPVEDVDQDVDLLQGKTLVVVFGSMMLTLLLIALDQTILGKEPPSPLPPAYVDMSPLKPLLSLGLHPTSMLSHNRSVDESSPDIPCLNVMLDKGMGLYFIYHDPVGNSPLVWTRPQNMVSNI